MASLAESAEPAGWLRARMRAGLARRAGIALGACVLLAVLFGTQNYVIYASAGEQLPWLWLVGKELAVWLNWALVAPVVFAAARRFPIGQGRSIRNGLVHVPIGIGISGVTHVLFAIEAAAFHLARDPSASVWQILRVLSVNSFAITLMIYGVIVAVYHAIDYYRAYQRRVVAASQLEARLAEARLDLLRMQLHPHFLFNTLHGISALMARDVQGARRMIACLSDLLRLSLEQDAEEEVLLEEELAFLGRYVEIQRMRFRERLRVEIDVEPAARAASVPRLLLQPIVENSIRHGISRHAHPGLIEIAARLDRGRLLIMVRDNGPGIGPAPLRQGVGLGNTRARLAQLYGQAGSFSIENAPEGGSVVEIVIPARFDTAPKRSGNMTATLENSDDAD